MNANDFAQSKYHLQVIRGGHAKKPPKEITCTRPDALFFRAQTLAIVRHFFEISCQVGRLPSILGREFFRAKVSCHGVPSFEEQAVFVHDVERALGRLNPQSLEVISLVGLYQYSLEEVALLLRRSRGCVVDRFTDAVDTLAQIFLTSGLLRKDRPDRRLHRFHAKEAQAKVAELPPKKPVGSVGVEPSHMVTAVSSKYSFAAQGRVV
jgi:hypothetical protein